MFGVGPQELLIIGLLFLVVFGPTRAAHMARDFGRFVSGAQRTVEDFKDELVPEEVEEARSAVREIKDEAQRSFERIKPDSSPRPKEHERNSSKQEVSDEAHKEG